MEFQTIDRCFTRLDDTPSGNISARIDILNEARGEVARLDKTVQDLEKSFSELESGNITDDSSEKTVEETCDVEQMLQSLETNVNNYGKSDSSLEELFQKFCEIRTELTRAKSYIENAKPKVVQLHPTGESSPVELGL
jgi:archaellum component FlaC